MKKTILFLVLLISLFVQAKTYTVVKSFTSAQCTSGATLPVVGNLDELLSITVDTAGTDTSFTVTLYETIDGVAYAIPGGTFTLSSANEPYRGLAIQSFDIDGNIGFGYPTNNPITVALSASDLTACKIIIKYKLSVAKGGRY
jgi:hypothetical protein